MSRLRILVIGEVFPDSFAENVAVSLADAGHETKLVSPFRPPLDGSGRLSSRLRVELPSSPRLALRAQRHVIEAYEGQRPDLILNVDFRLSVPIVRELARGEAPLAFWFPDSRGNLGRETHVLGGYDAIFLKDSTVVQRYRDHLGLHAHFLAEACNPRWHRPPQDLTPGDGGPAVVVAGNMYATRFALLRRLQSAGVELRIYGPPWSRWLPRDDRLHQAFANEYLARDAKAKAFRAATVVLNSMVSREADGANCRLFEAAACGAVVLSEWRDLLPSLFAVPEEVRAYRSFGELVDQVRSIIALEPAERRAMGDRAAARARVEHSYERRFETILQVLGRG